MNAFVQVSGWAMTLAGVLLLLAGLWVIALAARDAWRAFAQRRSTGLLSERQVRRALRKRYGAHGYLIEPDGAIVVAVTFVADDGSVGVPWWGPFGNIHDAHCHAALRRILAE